MPRSCGRRRSRRLAKMLIDKEKVKNLTTRVLSKVEEEHHVFCMWDEGAAAVGIEDKSRLLVCGKTAEGRDAAEKKIEELKDQEPPAEEWGGGDEKWEANDAWDEKNDDAAGDKWGASDESWKADDKKDEKADAWKADEKKNDTEKRIHKDDKTKTPYTYQEFVDFKMEKDWNNALPVQDAAKDDNKRKADDEWWKSDQDKGAVSWEEAKKDSGDSWGSDAKRAKW